MRSDRRSPAAATLVALALGLAGCGGGSAPAAPPVGDCELGYSLTGAPELVGPDPLLGSQWHLRNTGQAGGAPGEDLRALDAWDLGRGEGVRIAVVDDAIELVHPDLRPNVVEGASYSYRTGRRGTPWPLPCTAAQDDHGTAVAGLALARDDNALGGAGVAPRARLVGFDALSTSLDADIADALGRDRELNAIYNNSWGSFDNGQVHPAEPSFLATLEEGLRTGRGGLGSIFVFPAGNGGAYWLTDTSAAPSRLVAQQDNSNLDGYVNRLGIVTVCAVNDQGRRPWYAEPGANVLVCAPSSDRDRQSVTTTGLKGTSRDDFSGTSASTPMASGVVALMLSANPSLSWRDVRLILATTARKTDPSGGNWLPGTEAGTFSHWYGFGVVDARAAVERARQWRSVGGSERLRTCDSEVREPRLDIPDAPGAGAGATTVVDATTIAGCDITSIEHVEVRVTIAHGYSGDLRIRLRSPSDAVSELAEQRVCSSLKPNYSPVDCGRYQDWTFGSVRHLGESPGGRWQLEIADLNPADTGRLERWSVRVHGR